MTTSRGVPWRKTWLAAAALAVLGTPFDEPHAAADEGLQVLALGDSSFRSIAPGETHAYMVKVSESGLLAVLEPGGTEPKVRLWMTPGNDDYIVVEQLGPRRAPMVLAEDLEAGSYRLEIEARARGSYQLGLSSFGMSPSAGRGEKAESRAGILAHDADAAARREAILALTEAIAAYERAGSVDGVARALYSSAVLYRELGEIQRAAELLGEALPRWQELEDVSAEAETLNLLGEIDRLGARPDAARERFGRARMLHRELGDRCGEAKALNNLALLEHAVSPRRARPLYHQALALCGEDGDLGLAASSLSNLGSVARYLGEPDEAIALYQRAVPVFRELGWQRSMAGILNNLGVVHRGVGEVEAAFAFYREALTLRQRIGDRQGEASTLNSLGLAYLDLGEARSALNYFRRALPLRRELSDRRGEATTLLNLGMTSARLGQSAVALEFFRQSLGLRRGLEDSRGEANVLDQIGSAHLAVGHREAARQAFERALDLRRELGDPARLAATLRHLASLELATDATDTARELLKEAVELHVVARDPTGEAAALPLLARAERRLGETEAALGHLERALDLVEALRGAIGDPDLRASFLAARRDAYTAAIDLHLERARQAPGAGHARRAFAISERARARSLADVLREAGAEAGRGAPPPLLAERRAQLRRLDAKVARQRALLARRHSREELTSLDLEIEELRAGVERTEAAIRRSSPSWAAVHRPGPVDVEALQKLLDAETLVLEYALGEERSFVWLIGASTFVHAELPPRDVLEAAARDLYTQWSRLDTRAQEAEADVSRQLADQLLGPLQRHLAEGRRLVVVADGALQYLPFAALPHPATGEPLVASHEIIAMPSVAVLALLRQRRAARPAAQGGVVVLADPIFAATDPRLAKTPSEDASNPLGKTADASAATGAALRDGQADELPRLPATRREAAVIAELARDALLFLDAAASRDVFSRPDLRAARILHIATHGVLDSVRPHLSGLELSRFGSDGGTRDGFLSLPAIYGLDLSADLVVLSGCSTALGREIRGEGLVGLVRAFFDAGAAQVTASLWQVQDQTTAALMEDFYTALLAEGTRPAAALRAAQLSLWRKGYRDPYHWAAFVHQGDWK